MMMVKTECLSVCVCMSVFLRVCMIVIGPFNKRRHLIFFFYSLLYHYWLQFWQGTRDSSFSAVLYFSLYQVHLNPSNPDL